MNDGLIHPIVLHFDILQFIQLTWLEGFWCFNCRHIPRYPTLKSEFVHSNLFLTEYYLEPTPTEQNILYLPLPDYVDYSYLPNNGNTLFKWNRME